jgi:hypothetical protein
VSPDASLPGDVLALDALRRVAVAVDQVVGRHNDQECRFGPGRADGPGSPANADDLAEAERLVAVMDAGAKAGRKMIESLRAQFPKPATAPAPPGKPAAK